jgi:hypothetical protein
MNAMRAFLTTLDRRWIFLAMFIAVALPVYLQKTFPVVPTKPVKDTFALIESMPEGANVLVPIDYDPASEAELKPMTIATVRHLCKRKCKLFFLTLWPAGVPLVDSTIKDIVLGEFKDDYTYGRNVVNLGYKSGLQMVIQVIITDLRKQYPTDKFGTALDAIPMTKSVQSVRDMNLIVSLSAGTPGTKEWIQYASTPYKIPIVAGSTGVQATQMFPYYPNQLAGLLAAIKGAAGYEAMLTQKYPDFAGAEKNSGLRKMAPQLWAHLLVVGLIMVGNVLYVLERRSRSGGRS